MNADYLDIIQKYIPSHSSLLPLYVSHVTLVTSLALDIAEQMKLSDDQLDFIEEAAMLHDIGIIFVDAPNIWCHGKSPYIAHGYKGRELLEKEGLHTHALVCERHTGAGITEKDIIENDLPLPKRDMTPQSTEEKIIAYADKFFSKNPEELFSIKSTATIIKELEKHGKDKSKTFLEWHKQFQPIKYREDKNNNSI